VQQTQEQENTPPERTEEPSPPVTQPIKKRNSKKKPKDDEDEDDLLPFSKRSKHSKKKTPVDDALSNLVRFCIRCKRRFLFGTIGSEVSLCHACTTVKGKQQSNLQKQKRKKAENVVLEFTGGLNGTILPLRDMCLNVISSCIDEVDQLGWIEPETMLKFAKIISKRRQLNNRTVSLFLGPDEDQIELYDCTCILSLIRLG
jgi:DNA repair protein RAD7